MTLDKETWASPDGLLAKFDANEDGMIDFDEFKTMCVELFGKDEIYPHEYRVRDIFDIFDVDEDGSLNREEWLRYLYLIFVLIDDFSLHVIRKCVNARLHSIGL